MNHIDLSRNICINRAGNWLEIFPFALFPPGPPPVILERFWLELWPEDGFDAEARARSPQPDIPKEQSVNQFLGLPVIEVRYLGEPALVFASVCQRLKDGQVWAVRLDAGGWLWTMTKAKPNWNETFSQITQAQP